MRHWFKEYAGEQQLLLAVPFRDDVWRDQAKPAQQALSNLRDNLSAVIDVYCLTPETVAYDDIWLRDTLPLWFIDDTRDDWRGLLPQFDGWGGVQSHIEQDARLSKQLFGEVVTGTDWTGEGGMFSHNGEWLLVGFTSLCKRNPGYPAAQLKQRIAEDFAPLRPVFIETCLSADETFGHIDNLALFINDTTLIYSATDDPEHPDYPACRLVQQQLALLPDHIRQIALPLPYPQWPTSPERSGLKSAAGVMKRDTSVALLCSYVNVIVVGHHLVLPQYGLAEDDIALSILKSALPDYRIMTVNAREFVLGGGGLHCISHSLPRPLAQSLTVVDHAP